MIVDYFRPIYIAIIVFLLILLLFSIFYKGKHRLIIGIPMSIISLFCMGISAYYFAEEGNIADEKGIAPDHLSFYFLLFIVILSILNPIIFMKRDTTSESKIERQS